jgi:hypothetical protein
MGSRNDRFIDDERADALMLRLLARSDEPTLAQPPPDLVTRTARRLPAEPPALAAQLAARRRLLRVALAAMVLGSIALIALIGLGGMLAGQPRLALLFGDGTSGVSRLLLTLYLLAKPLVRSIGAVGLPMLVALLLTLAAGGWLWRRLLLSPVLVYSERRP